jgi:beta-lactamase superfamily II metal-dependent hydrolase
VLVADAGVPALTRAWDDAPFDLIQIAHHGSKRNASSALLDRTLGRVGAWTGSPRTAVVSVAPRSRKHPSPRVLRAYARRGCVVRATAGRPVRIAGSGN